MAKITRAQNSYLESALSELKWLRAALEEKNLLNTDLSSEAWLGLVKITPGTKLNAAINDIEALQKEHGLPPFGPHYF